MYTHDREKSQYIWTEIEVRALMIVYILFKPRLGEWLFAFLKKSDLIVSLYELG